MVLKTTLHVLFFPDMNFKKPDCIYYIDCKHYAAIAACAMELAPRHKEVSITHRFLLYDLKTEDFFDRLNQTSITLYGIN